MGEQGASDPHQLVKAAVMLAKQGMQDQALPVYQRAAEIFLQKGFVLKAVAVYRTILQLQEDNAQVRFTLADLYRQLALPEEAEPLYHWIGERFRESGVPPSGLTGEQCREVFDVLGEAQPPAPAEPQASAAMEAPEEELFIEEETDFQTLYDMGIMYKEMGQLDRAMEQLIPAARDQQRGHEALIIIGYCYMDQGNNVKAIACFNKALRREGLAQDFVMATKYEIALAFQRIGFNDEARSYFKEVASREPNYRKVQSCLASLIQ